MTLSCMVQEGSFSRLAVSEALLHVTLTTSVFQRDATDTPASLSVLHLQVRRISIGVSLEAHYKNIKRISTSETIPTMAVPWFSLTLYQIPSLPSIQGPQSMSY